MKWSVALFFAGLFATLGAFFILLSFGTDYWLLAWETCDSSGSDNVKSGDVMVNQVADDKIIFYHEGFFWRCKFGGGQDDDNMLKFWFTSQPDSKECTQAYLSPFPVSEKTHNTTTYDSAIIYRGFWSVFMLLGVAAIILGGFSIICGAPFTKSCLYKAGGGLFLIAGFFILLATVLFVIWFEVLDVVDLYKEHQKSHQCSGFQLKIMYGLSFMFAPVGVFFSLFAGLFFLLIGRAINNNCY